MSTTTLWVKDRGFRVPYRAGDARNEQLIETQLDKFLHEHTARPDGTLVVKRRGFRFPYAHGDERNNRFLEAQLTKFLHSHKVFVSGTCDTPARGVLMSDEFDVLPDISDIGDINNGVDVYGYDYITDPTVDFEVPPVVSGGRLGFQTFADTPSIGANISFAPVMPLAEVCPAGAADTFVVLSAKLLKDDVVTFTFDYSGTNGNGIDSCYFTVVELDGATIVGDVEEVLLVDSSSSTKTAVTSWTATQDCFVTAVVQRTVAASESGSLAFIWLHNMELSVVGGGGGGDLVSTLYVTDEGFRLPRQGVGVDDLVNLRFVTVQLERFLHSHEIGIVGGS